MRPLEEIKASIRLSISECDDRLGLVAYYKHTRYKPTQIMIAFTFDRGWEHASVSLRNRCPTWDEMCAIKDIFWGEEEAVMQVHPPRSEYVNLHPYCLHLWKPIGQDFIRPNKELVY